MGYLDLLRHMPLTTSSVINMHPDGVAPERPTAAKLMDMWRELQRIPVPPSMDFDLYGHPTITDMYELNLKDTLPELCPLFQPPGRRTLVMPKDRLQEVARALREAGADVRIEPRYGRSSESE